jgi:heat shock protein HslJ
MGTKARLLTAGIISIVLIAGLTGVGKATPQQTAAQGTPPKLEGVVWKWMRAVGARDGGRAPVDPNRYLLEFNPNGLLSIQADCNRVTGTYTVDSSQVRLAPGASTRAACPPGSLEREYMIRLQQVRAFRFLNGNLILEAVTGDILTFAPSAPAGLAGTAWKVVSYNNGRQAVVSVAIGSQITLDFAAGGRVSGKAGCNDFTGVYQSAERTIKIEQLASTKKLCAQPDGVMEQEDRYLKSLANAATFRIEGSRLTLRDANGAMQVVAAQ